MKVLMVSSRDLGGGAAIAAHRLAVALQQQGHQVRLLVQTKTSKDEFVVAYDSLKRTNMLEKIIRKIKNKWYKYITLTNTNRRTKKSIEDNPYTLYFGNTHIFRNLCDILKNEEYDILHIHWVDAFLRYNDLIDVDKPIFWTLHDCALFTGGCPHPFDCKGYQQGCDIYRSCTMLGVQWMNYFIRSNVKAKKQLFTTKNIHFIAPSTWMAQKMRESDLLKNMSISVIPNCIDNALFSKQDKALAKQKLGLSPNKRYIAYGAMNALIDRNKGYDLLQESLSNVDFDNIELLVFGATEEQKLNFCLPTIYLGTVDNYQMPLIYNAVDAMLVPSRYETFGFTAVEAMSCGTPVVAFAQGGCVDIIDHKKNGYLAEPYDTTDFRKGIAWCLGHTDELSDEAISKVENNYSMSIVAYKYIEKYEEI